MSAESVVHSAVLAAARGVAGLNGVFPGPTVKATLPYAELGEVLGGDWSVKDRVGRELRLIVTVRDAGDSPARAQALAGRIGAGIEALPRDLGGWCVASVVLVRSRFGAAAAGRWNASVEYRVRVLAR